MTFIDHITSTASSWMTSLGKNEREEHCSDRQTLIFNSLGFRKLKYFTYPLSRPTKLKLEDPGCSIFEIRNFYCANNSLAFDIEANFEKAADITLTGFSAKWYPQRNDRRYSILMTRHFQDLGRWCFWLVENLLFCSAVCSGYIGASYLGSFNCQSYSLVIWN